MYVCEQTDNATFGPSVDTYLPESATPSPWEWPWRTAAEQAIFDSDPTTRFEFDVTKGVGAPAPMPSLQDTHGGGATTSGAGAGAGAGATTGAVDTPPLPVQAAFDDPVEAELAKEAVESAATDALNTPESVWWKQRHKRDALLRYMATNPIGAVYAYGASSCLVGLSMCMCVGGGGDAMWVCLYVRVQTWISYEAKHVA